MTASLAIRTVAFSQDREPPAEALAFFERARDAYRHGRYADAARDLERALVLDPNAPTLLYNLGRVYELMGRYDDAIDVFTRLQAVTPAAEATERARTEQILERLRGAREHAAPPPTVDVVGTIEQGPSYVRERGVADEPFWITLSAGAGLTLLAAVLGGVALASHDAAAGRTLGPEYTYLSQKTALDEARLLGGLADTFGVFGGATLVGASLLFMLRERVYEAWPNRDRAAVRAGVGVTHAFFVGVF